jgi:hypothetical protein
MERGTRHEGGRFLGVRVREVPIKGTGEVSSAVPDSYPVVVGPSGFEPETKRL